MILYGYFNGMFFHEILVPVSLSQHLQTNRFGEILAQFALAHKRRLNELSTKFHLATDASRNRFLFEGSVSQYRMAHIDVNMGVEWFRRFQGN